MTLHRDDAAMSTVIGAIVILAILGIAVVTVNTSYVPRQGEALELGAREVAEDTLLSLASRLGSDAGAPIVHEFNLQPPRTNPPLLSGVILAPVRAQGSLELDPAGSRLSISHVTSAPASGVPAGDPMRVDEGGGLMRVYSLGNETAGQPAGALRLAIGGAYLESATYRYEAGAVILERGAGSGALGGGPALRSSGTPAAPTTLLAWQVPVLTGAAEEMGGVPEAIATFAPGPVARLGGGQAVHEVRIVVETDALAGWTATLQEALGGLGTVTVNATGPDEGTVTAIVTAPAGAPAGVPSVELDLSLVRYATTFGGRSG